MSLNFSRLMYYESVIKMNNRKNLKKMTALFVAVLVLASLTSLATAATDSITVLSGGNGPSTHTQNSTCTDERKSDRYKHV